MLSGVGRFAVMVVCTPAQQTPSARGSLLLPENLWRASTVTIFYDEPANLFSQMR